MYKKITEPPQWRASSLHKQSWASRRPIHQRTQLAADVVDAALDEAAAEPFVSQRPTTSELALSLANQLDLLEQQREQLQRLLAQAKG